MRLLSVNKFEQLWSRLSENSKTLKMIGYGFTVLSVFYILLLLYFGFDELKTISWSSLLQGFVPSLFIYLFSLIAQFLAWLIIVNGKINIRPADFLIFSSSILFRRLPGGIWHWIGRSTMYKKMGDIPLRESTISNFVEWSGLMLTGLGVYFAIQRNFLSIPFFIIPIIICFKWLARSYRNAGANFVLTFLLIFLYAGSWFLGALILGLNSRVILNIDLLPFDYLRIWTLSNLISMLIIFLPAGLGIREISLSMLLMPYLGLTNSVLLAVLIRIVFIFSELIWGMLGMAIGTKVLKTKQSQLK